jgi:four helix bundle protein
MGTYKSSEDMEVWQRARVLANRTYALTQTGGFSRDYSLKDQIIDSSGSVMDNIAEGFERGGNRELIMFLSYSKGSAGEVRSQLYRAFDQDMNCPN